MDSKKLKYTQSIYGILAILSKGPQSGYEIRKALDQPEMYYWRESYGNIYPMLKKLHKDGLLSRSDSYIKSKKRLIYQLNQQGWDELFLWFEEPATLNRFRVELLMKLRFGESYGAGNMISQLTHYRETSQEQLKDAEKLLETINSADSSLDSDLRKITISLFIKRKIAILTWCTDSIKILSKWITTAPNDTIAEKNQNISAGINSELLSLSNSSVVPMPFPKVPLME